MSEKFVDLEGPQQSASAKPNYIITDFFTNIDQASRATLLTTSGWSTRFLRHFSDFTILNPSLWLVLILLGVISAILGFAVDYLCETLIGTRMYLASSKNFLANFTIWVLYSVMFSLIAGCCGRWINSDAEGSGIPEMKSILAGVHISRYLSFTTLSAKLIGLITASAGGLSIGKEGPFVHAAGIIANKLTKIRCFKQLNDNLTLRKQILGASVAAGVAATFGAPIGGVLFSVEVTATYYIVNNLWKGIFCATVCVMCFTLLHATEVTDLIEFTHFESVVLNAEIFGFLILGLVCGLTGVLFVKASEKLITARVTRRYPAVHSRFSYIILVSSLCALFTYSTPFLQLSDKSIINEMFRADNLENYDRENWATPNLGLNLFYYFTVKLCLTALSISCQIPCGIFTPVFTSGAALGRLFGYLMGLFFSSASAGVYAVVGAAALTSSVTHTISVAVIVFELSGQIHYILPMLVGVLMSFAIANAFSVSIYDLLLKMKGLPYLPALKPSRLYAFKAADVMMRNCCFIPEGGCLQDVALAIHRGHSILSKIPVLDSKHNLTAEISVSDLKNYLIGVYTLECINCSFEAKAQLDSYFRCLIAASEENPLEVPQDFELDKSITMANQFWSLQVDFTHGGLNIDYAPFVIAEQSPLAKVHFLFIMLGLMQIYVTDRGQLSGVISREHFINNS